MSITVQCITSQQSKPIPNFTLLPTSCCVSINSPRVNYAWKEGAYPDLSSCFGRMPESLTVSGWKCLSGVAAAQRGTLKQLLKQLGDKVIHHLRSLWRRLWLLTLETKLTLLYTISFFHSFVKVFIWLVNNKIIGSFPLSWIHGVLPKL